MMKYDPVSAQVLSRCALYTLAHVFVFLLFFFFYEMKNYNIFRGGLFKFLIHRNWYGRKVEVPYLWDVILLWPSRDRSKICFETY